MDERLTARARFIYERDSTSPLFLITAGHYLGSNNARMAEYILKNGLKLFPEHPLAYILMGKVQYVLGNTEETKSCFRKAAELLYSEETFDHYMNDCNLQDRKISPFDSSRGNLFINAGNDFNSDAEHKNETPPDIEDNLKELSQKLLNARIERSDRDIPVNFVPKEYNPDKSNLATETLANIYLSQGLNSEAIKVYEVLAGRDPDKREHYLQKINDLKK